MRARYRERALVAATFILAVACAVVAWVAGRAFADPYPPRKGATGTAVTVPAIEEVAAVPVAIMSRTVDHDPFHAERRRPTTPFRLPSEEAAAHPATPAPAPTSALRLLGTVITPGADAFAMSQLGTDAPRVVRVGGSLGGFTLRRIESGRAVFIAPNGETFDLRVPTGGP